MSRSSPDHEPRWIVRLRQVGASHPLGGGDFPEKREDGREDGREEERHEYPVTPAAMRLGEEAVIEALQLGRGPAPVMQAILEGFRNLR